MINKTYIGIDPGKESYIVEITPEGEIVFNQIPMIGEEIDVRGLNEIFLNISLHSADIQAVIENVHAIFGASAKSTFSFGKTVGVLESLLVAHDIPFTKVQPKTWQKEMWEGVPNMKHPSSTGLTAVNDTKGIEGNSLNAQIYGTMVLFNGMKVISTWKRLNLIQKQGELELNIQVQGTISSVMETYYAIVRQQKYLEIIMSSIDLSKNKLEIVKLRREVGLANDADFLQSQIDLNSVEQGRATQELVIEQGKENLSQLMGIKNFQTFEIKDTILVDKGIKRDSILDFLKNNPDYLSADLQVRINEQLLKETAAQRYPSMRLNSGYNFSNLNNNKGSVLFSENYGPYIGLSLQIPIFNGNIYKTQQRVADYHLANSELQKENLYLSLKTDAEKAYNAYSSYLKQIFVQSDNFEL